MVDIVRVADAVFQVHVVIDGGKNVLSRDMLRDQIGSIPADGCLDILDILIVAQNALQNRIVDLLRDAELLFVAVDISVQINHQVRKHLHIALLRLHDNRRNGSILDLNRQLLGDQSAGGYHLSGCPVNDVLSQRKADNAVFQRKLLIEFIASHLREIVASRIKKHRVDQRLRTLHGERLARAQLFIELQQAVLVIVGRILGEAGKNLRLLAEHFLDLSIRADTERAQEHGDRHLAVPVYANIENIVGVRLIFKPCAAVRYNGAGIKGLSDLIVSDRIINTGGTHKLTDNNTLGPVDHKGSGFRHQRQVAHENVMFVDLVVFSVVKAHSHLERSRIGRVAFLALLDGVLGILLAKLEAGELETQLAAVIRNRGNIPENFIQTLIQKPLIRVFLNFDEIRHV